MCTLKDGKLSARPDDGSPSTVLADGRHGSAEVTLGLPGRGHGFLWNGMASVLSSRRKRMAIKGHCLCGSITYTCREEPVMTAACHCTGCQRQTGTACSVVVALPAPRLEVRRGHARDAHERRRGSRPEHQSPVLLAMRIADREPPRRDAGPRLHHGRHRRGHLLAPTHARAGDPLRAAVGARAAGAKRLERGPA